MIGMVETPNNRPEFIFIGNICRLFKSYMTLVAASRYGKCLFPIMAGTTTAR
jgi:hypothetical protein